ncbi:MAG: hypothetical protein LBD14_04360 [Puniceicoccales bacterium]|jgi:predicted hotdog family 3-hydroxylacyl-ACP dehydratase|nr:hypothetical protein [Puniceicoccales bacterium]
MTLPADVSSLLPHAPPMRFIHTLTSVDDATVTCETTIDADTFAPHLDEHRELPAAYLVEIMAQTVAAWAGYHDRANKRPLSSGLFLSCRHFQTRISSLPLNTHLRIQGAKIIQDNLTATFETQASLVHDDAAPFASSTLTTHQISWERLAELLKK